MRTGIWRESKSELMLFRHHWADLLSLLLLKTCSVSFPIFHSITRLGMTKPSFLGLSLIVPSSRKHYSNFSIGSSDHMEVFLIEFSWIQITLAYSKLIQNCPGRYHRLLLYLTCLDQVYISNFHQFPHLSFLVENNDI